MSPRSRRWLMAAGAGLVALTLSALGLGLGRGADRRHGTPTAASPKNRLESVRNWTFALGVAVADIPVPQLARRFEGHDLVVVDGTDIPAAAVRALQDQGSLVLAYVNVGAIEANRPWTADAAAFRLDHWEQWDEWYADVNQPGFRSLLTATVVPPVLAKGVDGLFLDNVDMVDTHPAQRAAMVGLVAELSATVHAQGGLVLAQNGEDATVEALVPHLDGWNREDVSFTYDSETGDYVPVAEQDQRAALATIRRLNALGIFVTSVDYLDDTNSPQAHTARATACAAGALAIVADIGLTRTDPPTTC
jgi:polysaccharide biosynthesis protein PelA